LAKATWIFAPGARLLCRGCFHGQAATKAGQDHGDIIAVESLLDGLFGDREIPNDSLRNCTEFTITKGFLEASHLKLRDK